MHVCDVQITSKIKSTFYKSISRLGVSYVIMGYFNLERFLKKTYTYAGS